jgi:hypothetical protein
MEANMFVSFPLGQALIIATSYRENASYNGPILFFNSFT